MNRDKVKQMLKSGLLDENPLLVLGLGVCPAIAFSDTVGRALAMGLAATVSMMASSVAISALKRIIPARVRIPCFMVIIASIAAASEYILRAFLPPVYAAFGIYLPITVTNCLVLGRAEAFASKRSIKDSVFDAFCMGLGYTAVLFALGAGRELLSRGTFIGMSFLGRKLPAFALAGLAPGGLFILGCIIAGVNKLRFISEKRRMDFLRVTRPTDGGSGPVGGGDK